jgi:glycosyltransferase involved in cell wall biosynthesis
MYVSVVVPAFNEEAYLERCLAAAEAELKGIERSEIIVVDNMSTDATPEIAAGFASKVLTERERNIAKVRNTGADSSSGEIILFLDADTVVRPGLLETIVGVMSDESCVGGSVAVDYEVPETRGGVWYYLQLAVFIGKIAKMRQGAAQFCRKEVFVELGGYDPTIFVGEDVEFHWRLDRLACSRGGYTTFIEEPKVLTSSRRFEKMSLWKTVVMTHPITIFLGWRVRALWKDWYENAVR